MVLHLGMNGGVKTRSQTKRDTKGTEDGINLEMDDVQSASDSPMENVLGASKYR